MSPPLLVPSLFISISISNSLSRSPYFSPSFPPPLKPFPKPHSLGTCRADPRTLGFVPSVGTGHCRFSQLLGP